MKHPVRWLLVAILCLAAAGPVAGQSADPILEKMIQASGGRKALAAVKDTTISGTLEMVQFGMNGALTMYQKEPDKIRMDVEVMGTVITQAYDGKTAWMINPQTGAAEEMPEAQAKDFKRQAMGNQSLLDPAKFGITYKVLPNEKVGDVEYVVLQQTMADGFIATLLLDPKTYLPAITRAKTMNMAGAEVDAETVFSDYRKEGDLMVAHGMTVNQGGAEFMRMIITKVVYNSGLQDSFFEMSK